MIDLVSILEEYADGLGWGFSYGNKANQNLITSDLEDGKIYLILDPVSRKRPGTENGGEGKTTFSGSFMLLVKSTVDNVYYSQKGGRC